MTRPFVQFLKELCRTDGLVDVAPEGRARQSSLSRWSRGEDPQRAVQSDGREFAFHTEFEDSPWWQLDFEATQYPEYIVVSNRRNARFHVLAAELRVEVSENGSDWMLLHAGTLHFGSDTGEGLPLVLPTMALIPVRHLRLSLEGHTALHLASVQVLARSYAMPGGGRKEFSFLANRTDGFGERLKSIVNAMALAKHFGGDLVIDWKMTGAGAGSFHAIGDAVDTFSPEFRNRHIRPASGKMMPLSDFMALDLHAAPRLICVQVPQQNILATYPALRRSISPQDMSDAFWRIGFSDALQAAIDAAQSLDLPEDSTGIHLRAGDIVYGRYRFGARYANKVVPWPIAEHFLAAERAAGRSVLLFGQDEALCRAIAHRHGALFAGEWHEQMDFDATQAAIFDIVAMSRCARVVSGNSGFSQIAAIVGAFEQIDPLKLLSPSDAATLLREKVMAPPDDGSVSAHQNAFAAWYGVYFHRETLSRADRLALLRVASRDDPANAFYAIVLAVELFEAGELAEADRLLEACTGPDAPHEPRGSAREILGNQHPDGTYTLDRFAPPLKRMAEKGLGSARVLAAAAFHVMGHKPTAEALASALDEEGRDRLQRLLSR